MVFDWVKRSFCCLVNIVEVSAWFRDTEERVSERLTLQDDIVIVHNIARVNISNKQY